MTLARRGKQGFCGSYLAHVFQNGQAGVSAGLMVAHNCPAPQLDILDFGSDGVFRGDRA